MITYISWNKTYDLKITTPILTAWLFQVKSSHLYLDRVAPSAIEKEPCIKLRLHDKKFTSHVVVLFSSLLAPIGKTMFIIQGYYATCSVEVKGL